MATLNLIQIKRSAITDTPTELQPGELAYSYASGKLFAGDAANGVMTVGGDTFLNHTPGVLTSNAALVANSTGWLDEIKVSTLTVDSIVNITGNTTFTGPQVVNGTLEVVSTATFSNTANVVGAVALSNTLTTVGYANVANTLQVTGAVTFSNTLTTTGYANVANTLQVTGATTLSNTANIVGFATFSNNVSVAGYANVGQTLEVTGDTTLHANVQIDQNLNVTNTVHMSNTLQVNGATVINATANVDGAAAFNNTVTISNMTDNRLVVVGTGGILTDDANITYDGTTLFVNANATVAGDLTVEGTTTIVHSSTVSVGDNMFKFAANNTVADVTDIGFYGVYNDGAQKYSAFYRDASDGKYKLTTDIASGSEPGATVSGGTQGILVATLESNNVTITGGTITGIQDLATADGGTGLSAFTQNGVWFADTTSTIAFATGSNYDVLQLNGSGVPSFGSLDGGSF